MEPVSNVLRTPSFSGYGNRNSGTLSEADKLEMCKRGERFPERIYEPPVFGPGCKCPLCGDEGWRYFWYDGYQFAEECECHRAAMSAKAIHDAGVSEDLTFENFYTYQPFQQEMLNKAREYAKGGYLSGQWFFIGGQVGCGKTHLCTAIVHEMIKQKTGCRYMMWKEESVKLKAIVNDHAEYGKRLDELTKAPVLYIDDLFKTQAGMKPTQADVNLAFQIINARYQDKKYVTIFSCELSTMELISIDEAVGSRIHERARAYELYIAKDASKNFRIKDLFERS